MMVIAFLVLVSYFPLERDEYDQNSEINEMLIVGGTEIPEAEIVDLWHSSKEGDYIQLTGNRTLSVSPDEVERVRDFLEHRNYLLGNRRTLNVNGKSMYDDEIAEVVYQGKTPFVKKTDGRLIEIKPVEVYAIEYFVNRNRKLRGEI